MSIKYSTRGRPYLIPTSQEESKEAAKLIGSPQRFTSLNRPRKGTVRAPRRPA